MVSLDYKLSDTEKRDLISCCVIKGNSEYRLTEISNLPYGYVFYFKDKSGYGNALVVNIYENKGKGDIDVLPQCKFAEKVKSSIEEYFNNHKEFK